MDTARGVMPLQYGMVLETEGYREQRFNYRQQPILYYQFSTSLISKAIRVVPDGCADLLFCCSTSSPHALLCGTVLQGKQIPLLHNADYFGVRLTPFQSLHLDGLPFREFVDKMLLLSEVVQTPSEYCERIAEQDTFTGRIEYFETSILPRLITENHSSSTQLVGYCLEQIYASGGNLSIGRLVEKSGYSSRHLRQIFEDTVGISPKLFSRIIRFQHTLELLMQEQLALMDVAALQGYYDQAHLIKDFKQFSLLSPLQMKMLRAAKSFADEL